jgi:hypothetical protein
VSIVDRGVAADLIIGAGPRSGLALLWRAAARVLVAGFRVTSLVVGTADFIERTVGGSAAVNVDAGRAWVADEPESTIEAIVAERRLAVAAARAAFVCWA